MVDGGGREGGEGWFASPWVRSTRPRVSEKHQRFADTHGKIAFCCRFVLSVVVVTLTRCASCGLVVVAVVFSTTAHRIQWKIGVCVGRGEGVERRGRCGVNVGMNFAVTWGVTGVNCGVHLCCMFLKNAYRPCAGRSSPRVTSLLSESAINWHSASAGQCRARRYPSRASP